MAMSDGGSSTRDIGRRLTALREAMGYNGAAFARLVDISQSAMANYEAGTRRPDLNQAFKIVNRTGVTLDWLYLGVRSGLPAHLHQLLPPFRGGQSKAG
jgi:transcriptional regulator with XRE-family HTH domain